MRGAETEGLVDAGAEVDEVFDLVVARDGRADGDRGVEFLAQFRQSGWVLDEVQDGVADACAGGVGARDHEHGCFGEHLFELQTQCVAFVVHDQAVEEVVPSALFVLDNVFARHPRLDQVDRNVVEEVGVVPTPSPLRQPLGVFEELRCLTPEDVVGTPVVDALHALGGVFLARAGLALDQIVAALQTPEVFGEAHVADDVEGVHADPVAHVHPLGGFGVVGVAVEDVAEVVCGVGDDVFELHHALGREHVRDVFPL